MKVPGKEEKRRRGERGARIGTGKVHRNGSSDNRPKKGVRDRIRNTLQFAYREDSL